MFSSLLTKLYKLKSCGLRAVNTQRKLRQQHLFVCLSAVWVKAVTMPVWETSHIPV